MDPGQSVDGAGIGHDPIMQHAILVDEVEIELIHDVTQSIDAFHSDATARQTSRATPTAASSLSDVTTGTPRVAARMRRQHSFAAPPPTVATRVGRGPPSSDRRR